MFVFACIALPLSAQVPSDDQAPKAEPTPELSGDELKGVQAAESVILVYSNLRGRAGLDQIRKTWVEFGTLDLTDENDVVTSVEYELRILRGDNLEKAKVRLDQRLPSARFALIYDGTKVFGLFERTVFDPRNDAATAFSNRVFYGLDALLRYRESGSSVVFDRDEKVQGVNYSVLKLTTKKGQEIFYFVSKKSFRVMLLEFQKGDVKYRRKFYDYNYAQNTLFPYRTVLWANGKKIEEQRTATVTFGQQFGDEYFEVG